MAKAWMCTRCRAGSTENGLSKRRCAFTASGRFRKNNWNCETMIALRSYRTVVWGKRDDLCCGSIGVIELPDDMGPASDEVRGYLVLTWYKDRGSTPGAIMLADEGKQHSLTLARAQRILEVKGG